MKNVRSLKTLKQRAVVGLVLGKRSCISSEVSQIEVGMVMLKGMMPCSLRMRILIVHGRVTISPKRWMSQYPQARVLLSESSSRFRS